LGRGVAMALPIPVVDSAGPDPSQPGRVRWRGRLGWPWRSARRQRPRRRGHSGRHERPVQRGRLRPRDQWVVRALSDRSAWAAVDAAAPAVSGAADTAWPYAMLVGRQTVTALLAGPLPPGPPGPWRETGGGWLIDRGLLSAASGDGTARPSDTFVALGSCGGGALLLDLACAPTVITITGDPAAARDLMRSLVTQLQVVPRNRVFAAASALPGTPCATPAGPLDRLDLGTTVHDGAESPWTFLVCVSPALGEAIRLRARGAADRMRVLVLGNVRGSRWSLLAGADGEVTADGLGLGASSRPILSCISNGVPPRRHPLPEPGPVGATLTRPRAAPRAASSDEGETWPPRVAPASPFARAQNGQAHLPAYCRAFAGDELDAAVKLHPALAPVPERDPTLDLPLSAPSAGPSPAPSARSSSAGSEPTCTDGPMYGQRPGGG
jgi:hypothetical protein